MATKLHQHLITETDTRNGYEKLRNETLKVFKGESLLEGLNRTYRPKDEGGDPLAEEKKEVTTTVPERLAWTRKPAVRQIDFEATRDVANTKAKADLEVNGTVIAKDLPATFLLSLEKRLREIRDYYDAIPTLDMAITWEDTQHRGIWKNQTKQFRTAKKLVPVVLYEATEKHPAQVKEATEDVMIGIFETTKFSGKVHPGTKAGWLERIDVLIEATKKARMKANEQEVTPVQLAEKLFDFIHEDED